VTKRLLIHEAEKNRCELISIGPPATGGIGVADVVARSVFAALTPAAIHHQSIDYGSFSRHRR
jgi:hypothetical protein